MLRKITNDYATARRSGVEWIVGLAVLLFALYLVLRVVRAIKRFVARVGRALGGSGQERQSASRSAPGHGSDERSSRSEKPRWYGLGTTLKVGSVKIQNPLAYASDRAANWSEEPSEINIRLPLQPGAPFELNYWPWYSRIPPAARFAYVDWLAGGRSALPGDDGLLFLYYYGLERRALADCED
jgi:hypothetical protein